MGNVVPPAVTRQANSRQKKRSAASSSSLPGQLTIIALSLAAALSAPQAWSQTSLPSATTQFEWTQTDLDISLGTSTNISVATGPAIHTQDMVGTLSNAGTIHSNANPGVHIDTTGGAARIDTSGTITGDLTGIYNGGTIGTLSNAGAISSTSSAISGNNSGIINAGTITLLDNNGTISGELAGIVNTIGGQIATLINTRAVIAGNSSANGINNLGTIGSLTNNGTISANGLKGVGINNSGSITSLSNVGLLAMTGSTGQGIVNNGTIGALSNSGMIAAIGTQGIGINNGTTSGISTLTNTGTITGNTKGISNSGRIDTLTNSATVSAVSTAIVNFAGGTIGTLSNSGSLSAAGYGVNNKGLINTLSNDVIGTVIGTIAASATTGVLNDLTGTIGTLTNAGLIRGSSAGIGNLLGGTIFTIDNSGTILATTGAGISNDGRIDALSNSGTLNGNTIGLINTGTIVSLNNSGLITASGGIALKLDSTSSISTFTNSGTIVGNVLNQSTSALNINGGTGSIFGTLTGMSGSIGALSSTGGVNFVSGNQLLNDSINVGSGSGTVTNSAGTLQLNNHISVTGNYAQSAAANLAIGVSNAATSNGVLADTGYGRLMVTGNATVASGSSVTLKALNTYAFAIGQRFVVIQAGSATYNASSLNYSATGFSGSITGASVTDGGYTDLVLTLADASSGSSTPSGLATTNNAISALNGLYRYGGINQQLLNVFNPALALNDTASANRAGAQLNPAAVQNAAAQGTDAANRAVLDVTGTHLDNLRLAQSGSSGVATGERSYDPALWGQFFGGGATQDERDSVSGYHSNYRGLLVGGDLQVTDNWRAGGLFSYAKTNVGNDDSNTGSSASVNSYGLTAYAGYDGKPWYVNLMAGVAQQKYSTSRAISYTGFSGNAYGNFNGLQSTASVQAGYPLALANDMTLTPMAGLTYSKLRQNGYTESGGSGAALIVSTATTTSLKSDFGAKLDRKFQTSYGDMTPSLQLRWRHEFQNSRLNTGASFAADTTGATSFTTMGATPLRNTGVMVLGMTLARSKNVSIAANYTLEAGRGYTSQTGDVKVRWQY
jgi:outer membrane autotransporter protein